MQRVYKLINDAKAGYIKTKLKAKSKKQTEEATQLFADLADFSSKQDIQDYYGWGEISRSRYEHLMNLWDEREAHTKEKGVYRDRVINMLEKAISHIGDDYQDFLYEAGTTARENNRNQQNKFPGG